MYKIVLNFSISDIYRIFEQIVEGFKQFGEGIPLTFMLGFYVALVVKRWSLMYRDIGWIDM